MKKHPISFFISAIFFLFNLEALSSHAASLLEIENGENGDFQINYKGHSIFTNRVSWDHKEKYSNPGFISLEPSWHGIRVMGLGQPVEIQDASHDGKKVLWIVEKSENLGEVSHQISMDEGTVEIKFAARIKPNNLLHVDALDYSFPLPSEVFWDVPLSDNGKGYQQPKLDQTWLDLLEKSDHPYDDVRYDFTQLKFERPDAVISYLFDGPPKAGNQSRSWRLRVDKEKNICLQNISPFPSPEGIDLKFTLTIKVEPR